MPDFEFEVLSADGGRSGGSLMAGTLAEAAGLLRHRGLRILQLRATVDSGVGATKADEPSLLLADRLARRMPVRQRDIIHVFQHLGMMLRSGLTLTTALHLLADECPKPGLKKALRGISRRVEGGQPFSIALEDAATHFSILTRSIIASAEETGELAEGAERIAINLDFWLGLRAKVVQALVYPAIVLVLAVLVTVIMVFFFLPKVERFIAAQGRGLPPVTRALFDAAHFIQNQWGWLLLGVAALAVLLWLFLRARSTRRWLELGALNLPVLGRVIEASQMARLAGLLSVMLRSGTDLVRALDLGQSLTRLHLYREVLSAARGSLVAGRPLREALRHPIMPRTFLGVVAAGEESGALVTSFAELEKFYGQRLASLVLTLVGLLEPALLIAVGGVVGIVYLALFSAITSLVR